MLIECDSCRARYRLKASMLKGFKGAEVRCRKCGGTIVVLTPGRESRTPGPTVRGERRSTPRRQIPAKGKDVRAAKEEAVPPVPPAQDLEQDLEQKEGGAQAAMALREDAGSAESAPDNVFQLDLFREAPPKHPPSESYDISENIRMVPAVPPARNKLTGDFLRLPSPPPERRDPVGPIVPEEPFPWKNEGVTLLSTETPLPFPGGLEDPESSSSRKAGFQGSYSPVPGGPRPSHVAIVYLLLLLLGGCGYLLVRFLAKIAGGGI